MAKNDPLKNLKTPSHEDLKKEVLEQQSVGVEPLPSEVEKLQELVQNQGKELETLRKVAEGQKAALSIEQVSPQTLQRIWDMAYQSALASVFRHDLSHWNNKPTVLKKNLQLAVIRADETLEALIAVRKTCVDPVQKQLQDWQKNKGL